MLDGVDIDINFGPPLDTAERTGHPAIKKILSGSVNETFDQEPKVRRHLQKTATEMMQVYMTRITQEPRSTWIISSRHCCTDVLSHLLQLTPWPDLSTSPSSASGQRENLRRTCIKACSTPNCTCLSMTATGLWTIFSIWLWRRPA
jgi:hypothetical protein